MESDTCHEIGTQSHVTSTRTANTVVIKEEPIDSEYDVIAEGGGADDDDFVLVKQEFVDMVQEGHEEHAVNDDDYLSDNIENLNTEHENHMEVKKKPPIGDNPFQCLWCYKIFTNKEKLTNHEVSHTRQKPYHCAYCEKKFSRSSHLRRHEKVHTAEKPHKCSVCDKRFFQKSQVRRHERVHTGEKPYSCDLCDKSFSDKSLLQRHQLVHSGIKPFQCQDCGKTYNQNIQLTIHQRTHTGEKPYQCNWCGKKFTHSGTLRSHERTHTGERPYHCQECGKDFSQHSHFTRHKKTHVVKANSFQCKICSEVFQYRYDLEVHILTHPNSKPFHCDQCTKKFETKASLKRHALKKHQPRPYTCDYCKLTFADLDQLCTHESVHLDDSINILQKNSDALSDKADDRTVEIKITEDNLTHEQRVVAAMLITKKPFQCRECKKRFQTTSHLKEHERIHSGEKPYNCQFCKKAFSRTSHLNRHELIHSGLKPFHCDWCDKTFVQLIHKKRHEKTHLEPNDMYLQQLPNKNNVKESDCEEPVLTKFTDQCDKGSDIENMPDSHQALDKENHVSACGNQIKEPMNHMEDQTCQNKDSNNGRQSCTSDSENQEQSCHIQDPEKQSLE